MKDAFRDDIVEMENLGVIYRQIKKAFNKSVSMTYADPRNIFTIWHYHLAQWRKQRISFRNMVKSLDIGVRRHAIFCNGHWVN